MKHSIQCTVSTLLASACIASAQAQTAAPTPQPVVVRASANFDFDRAGLRPADRDALLADVAKLTDVTWQSVTATGHTDSVGKSSYNARLSARRAKAVKDYLVGKGLDSSMIAVEAKAADVPVASNDTEQGRASNRRTDIEFRGVRVAKP